MRKHDGEENELLTLEDIDMQMWRGREIVRGCSREMWHFTNNLIVWVMGGTKI